MSIVVSHRKADDHRERLFEWVWARYERLMPEAELVRGEMTSGDEFFCLAEARNNGVRRSTRPIVLLSDADVVAFREAIEIGVEALSDAAWVLPYNSYDHLDRKTTECVLRSPSDSDPRDSNVFEISASYPDSNSGLVLVTRDRFWESGGFDERFRSWAPEDQAWASAITTLCGPPGRVMTADLYHLWHPRPAHLTTGNPNYEASMMLWDQYKTASGDPDAMRTLVNRARGARR